MRVTHAQHPQIFAACDLYLGVFYNCLNISFFHKKKRATRTRRLHQPFMRIS